MNTLPQSKSVVLWRPAADARVSTRLGQFMDFAEQRCVRTFANYNELWQWSVDELEEFWAAVWDFFDVQSSHEYSRVLTNPIMPGARWFEGARLNYAEHALRYEGDKPAVLGRSQTVDAVSWSRDELRDQVARIRAGLEYLGVKSGDVVAAYLPNIPETIAAFLATASLGAIWTSCAPEFGVRAVLDRFSQVQPKVLLAIDGYRYGSRVISRVDELDEIRSGLPTVHTTVVLPYLNQVQRGEAIISWEDLTREWKALEFAQVATDHPLYVLYSSGTTGLPKPIVHAHGGILIEHLKVIGLHSNMNEADIFFWFTTTGWMMWNYFVSGLLVGATVVTFDGDPNYDGPITLWQLAADEHITWFGVGAPYLVACWRAELQPSKELDLSQLHAVGSTGAPLPIDAFYWVYESVKNDVMLSSISGGTDICSAFVGGSPLSPVIAGEISCRYLGVAVEAFDESGQSVTDQQGELVVTAPMPSMPVGFWGDDDGSRYKAAYFSDFPGTWRHGDWITITAEGSCVISGRSDATLNRGGIRVGTAELYRVVENIESITDSLVVHLEDLTGVGPGILVLFVVCAEGVDLDDALRLKIRLALRNDLSPRHVPDEIYQVANIPTTLSGKKLEIPVKKILLGSAPATVASAGSLKDPTALTVIATIAMTRLNPPINTSLDHRSRP